MTMPSLSKKIALVASIIFFVCSCVQNASGAKEPDAKDSLSIGSADVQNIDLSYISLLDIRKNYSYKGYDLIGFAHYSPSMPPPLQESEDVTALFVVEESYGSLVNTMVVTLDEETDEITGEPIIEAKFEGNAYNNYAYVYLFKGLKKHSKESINCFQFSSDEEWYKNLKTDIKINSKLYTLKLKDWKGSSTLTLSSDGTTQILANLPFEAGQTGSIYPELFTDIDGDGKPDLVMFFYIESPTVTTNHCLLFLSSEADKDDYLKLVALRRLEIKKK